MTTNKWEVLSHISTLLATIISVLALFFGIYQYNVSIEKTDEQIEIMRLERKRLIGEGRPLITIDHFEIENTNEEPPPNYPKYWVCSLFIKNIGIRPALDLTLQTTVLASNIEEYYFEDTASLKILSSDTINYSNPFPNQFMYGETLSINHGNYKRYRIKATLKYRDEYTDSLYSIDYYYLNQHTLWAPYEIDEFDPNLKLVNLEHARFIDSMIVRLNKSN